MEIKQKQFVSLEIHMMKCLTQMYEMYDTDLCQIIAFALVKALEALLNICDLEPKWWGFELISLKV